jgi:hypothetical protein
MHECYNDCPSGQAGVNEKKEEGRRKAETVAEDERNKKGKGN